MKGILKKGKDNVWSVEYIEAVLRPPHDHMEIGDFIGMRDENKEIELHPDDFDIAEALCIACIEFELIEHTKLSGTITYAKIL